MRFPGKFISPALYRSLPFRDVVCFLLKHYTPHQHVVKRMEGGDKWKKITHFNGIHLEGGTGSGNEAIQHLFVFEKNGLSKQQFQKKLWKRFAISFPLLNNKISTNSIKGVENGKERNATRN